jgi:hypothetical protein|tara:strand:- start:83 stop:355 length:273 start_codon:yes stop_codon:yes gene_type:complete
MKITRQSILSKNISSMDIDVTHEQIAQWESGVLIHQAMPHLCEDEREFIMTGITPDEWDTHMVGEEDDDDGQPTWEQEWEDYGEVYSDEY